jgi:hypothetical protein
MVLMILRGKPAKGETHLKSDTTELRMECWSVDDRESKELHLENIRGVSSALAQNVTVLLPAK